MMQRIVFAVMAMRDVRFFVGVAQRLQALHCECDVRFISFYQAGNDHIREHGFTCYDTYRYIGDTASVDQEAIRECEARYGVANIHKLILHEKLTSGRYSDGALEAKFVTYLDGMSRILQEARRDAERVAVVQELGGFIGPLALYHASRPCGVEHIFLEPSFFRGRLHFVRNSLNAVDCASAPADGAADDESARVAAYLDELRHVRSPVIPDKDVHHFRDMGLHKIFNRGNIGRLARKLLNKYVYGYRHEFDFIMHYGMQHGVMYLNRKRNAFWYQQFDAGLQHRPYVYFPLHVRLDYALTIRSTEYLDQLALVGYLCHILPAGVSLYIKEHPASIGGFSYREMKQLLQRHPNLCLIHPQVNSYDLVEHARAVVTINSKAGAEAVVMGRKVLVLGDAFYSRSDLVTFVENLRAFEPTLRNALASGESGPTPQAVQQFFARVWRHTHSGELYNLDVNNIDAFAKVIGSFLTRKDQIHNAMTV